MATEGVVILGSTGSIGCSTLDVLSRNRDLYHVVALTAHSNFQRLAEQCKATGAAYAVISDEHRATDLQDALSGLDCPAQVICGEAGLLQVCELPEANIVMAGIVGAAGMRPTLHAVLEGKRVLLANKEAMVIAGPLFQQALEAGNGSIVPVDSEHNALFQALPENFRDGLSDVGVEKLILTASGGPFLDSDINSLSRVTPEQACNHPNWDMGRKISVDSATLMNKGLEVIEARWLFNAKPGQIEVLVHPQSIVHSMVAYRDGSVLAQMGQPDMRTPIAHALAWPRRIDAGVAPLDLARAGQLEFSEPDLQRFPCLRLAFSAMADGGTAPAILNAANEIAVQAFLDGHVEFLDIPEIVEETLQRVESGPVASLEAVMMADGQARQFARNSIEGQVKIHG